MTPRSARLALSLLIVGSSPLWAGPALAALGSDASSIQAEATEWHGVVSSEYLQQYDLWEISTESGMRVREYLGRDGIVFAVSWSGPVLPDLQQLLGTHYPEYTAGLAALTQPGLRRSLRLASPNLVVESGGHLRAFAGRAYLPAQIPAGLSAAELR